MIEQESTSISISQRFQVRCPASEDVLPVPLNQWQRIINRIENCAENTGFYQNIAWCCFGFAGSALLSAVALFCSVSFVTVISTAVEGRPAVVSANVPAIVAEIAFIFLAIGGVGCGLLSLKFAKQHASDRADLRSVIVEDMRSFRDAFERDSTAS